MKEITVNAVQEAIQKQRRYILTGGPGSGKTAVLKELENLGITCVRESARGIIRTRLSKGLPPRPEPKSFAKDILAADIKEYDRLRNYAGPVFLDRGVIDALGMLFSCNAISMDEVKKYIQRFQFDKQVFMFLPWSDIYKQDSERDQTFLDAVNVATEINKWYSDLGFSIVEMPEDSPAKRAAFIITKIPSLGFTQKSKKAIT